MTQTDPQWNWWRSALQGKIGPIVESRPQSGFYRARNGDPVAFWINNGAHFCRRNGVEVPGTNDRMSLWIGVAKTPVSRESYLARVESGEWPESPSPRVVGKEDNLPSDPYLNLKARVDDELERARDFLRSITPDQPLTQALADKARNTKANIESLTREAKKWKEVEKRPILDAGEAVETKFKAVNEPMSKAGPLLEGIYNKFLKEETDRRNAEAKAKYEAEKKAAEILRAEVEAQRAKQKENDPVAFFTSPEPELPDVPDGPEPVKVMVGGLTGNRAGLKAKPAKLVIKDWNAAFTHYLTDAAVRDVVEKRARQDQKNGTLHSFAVMEEDA